MSQFTYHVVPFVGQLKGGADVSQVSKQLEDLINYYASQGWDFYSLDNVDIEVTPGCIQGLMGARTAYITYNQVIFRRPQ